MKKNTYTHLLCRCAGMLLLMLYAPWVLAQNNVTVSGKVTSQENNSGLPGVNVVVKGTTTGTTTNAEGIYTISAPENSTLVFSFIGYINEEEPIGNRTAINVAMVPDIKALSEVVVIGYGEREKKDLTGSIAQITTEEIKKSPALTPELAMQGRMAGVFVSSPGGAPNERPTVRIRGVGTLGNNEPLYVIDGVPVAEFGVGASYTISGAATSDVRGTQNIFNLINPNDIESISVLKDASAAAIYGVRAANGVVIITTKRGKTGTPKVSFDVSRGIQNVTKTYDMLNTQEFTALYNESFANNTAGAEFKGREFFTEGEEKYLGNAATYNWQEELLNKNATIENYNLSISGGNQASNYSVSGGYAYQESVLKNNNLKRYSLAVNSDHKIKKWLQIGESYRLAYTDANDNTIGSLETMAGVSPWQPIFDPAGPGGFAKSFGGDPGPYGAETEANHFAIMHFSSNRYDMVRNIGSAYVQVMPIDGLRFKGTLSADFFNNRRRDFNSKERGAFRDIIGNSTYGERHTRNTNLTKEFSINYTKAFGNHSIDLLANAMEQTFTWDGIQGSAQNIFSDDPAFWGIHGVAADRSADTFREQWALQGLMGRVSYNFQSKYYFDATVRQDVSSRFAPEYRKGIFPSIGVAWRISAENFMKGLPFINDLKIRGGWGQLGNQDTRAFAYLSLVNRAVHYPLGNISYSNTEGKTFPGTGAPLVGASIVDFPTRNLTWETSTATNIGLDGALLNNALTFTVEYYNRTTDDILQEVSLPASTGYSSRPVFNVASVNNRGMEFSLGYNGKAGGFTYNVSGNLTTVKNEVLKLNGGTPLGGGDSRIEEGYPINSIYGYQTVGIFQTQEQVNNWLAAYDDPGQEQQKAPGDIQFADLYGEPTAEDLASGGYRSNKPDGKVNDRDQAILGSTIPGHFYGLNLGAGYKGFDLSIFFQGVGDLQRINYFRWGAESMSSNGVNQLRTTLDRWTTANPSTTMPRAIYGDPSGNNRLSNRWVEDAGFLRLKNLQLGYSLPAGVLQKLGGMDQVRIYFGSTNTLTFTRYTGLDPENPGVPPARIFMLGANVTF